MHPQPIARHFLTSPSLKEITKGSWRHEDAEECSAERTLRKHLVELASLKRKSGCPSAHHHAHHHALALTSPEGSYAFFYWGGGSFGMDVWIRFKIIIIKFELIFHFYVIFTYLGWMYWNDSKSLLSNFVLFFIDIYLWFMFIKNCYLISYFLFFIYFWFTFI